MIVIKSKYGNDAETEKATLAHGVELVPKLRKAEENFAEVVDLPSSQTRMTD